MVHAAGWQWEPVDRPMFREIHIALDNMIHTSSAGEGKSGITEFNLSSFSSCLRCVSFFIRT